MLRRWRDPVFFYMREPGILSSDGQDWRGALRIRGLEDEKFIVFRYMLRREAFSMAWEMFRAALRPDPKWRRRTAPTTNVTEE